MGFKLSLILGGLLVATVSGSAFYIKYLNNQISTLQANQIVLEDKITEQNESIKNYLTKQKETMAQMQTLEAEKQEAVRSVTELRNKFARHDLNNLALVKPGLIEKRVNAGSKKVFDELTSITSPRVEEDENISPNN
jgi:cell division protein FtsB|tara:strand:- start:1377 stop:1787 length:411 start_codon:yes stop_codon:yes gene_type:complete